ncbi:TrmH family RNA methyltransferase [Varibaculum prostatecancerukia]|uniref:TrmH family RNA methyltransferase n=1 Tax=Varibaculum prostatecancerukia TaxID=2811781 RepID=UPI001C0070CF|nr:RNA methyltransferase [Varibaculum prostatecancerukia]
MLNLRLDTIDNPRSQRVRTLVNLSRRSFRLKQGLLLVEGPQACAELLRFYPDAVRDVYLVTDAPSPAIQVAREALGVTSWVHPVTRQVMNLFAPSAQGIAATADLSLLPSEKLPSPDILNEGVWVVCARVQDPGNLGTIIRIADACGLAGVLALEGCADPSSPKVIRASAGSLFHLPVYSGGSLASLAGLSAENDGYLVGLSGSAETDLPTFTTSGMVTAAPLFICLGNEARGLSSEEIALCNETISIPMWGQAESLNVATAAAITLHAIASARTH